MEITKIDEKTRAIEDRGVRMFLLEGNEKALLIDSGMTTKNIAEDVKTLTDLPVELVNTHADMDHIAGNEGFEFCYMNPAEAVNYYAGKVPSCRIEAVWDGDVIDLGGRKVEVITIPGHTPGSIALLDEENGMLFSGDPVQDGKIFMFGVMRDMHAYRMSLKKLERYEGRFTKVYPSHGTCPVEPSLIGELYVKAGEILEGKIPYAENDMRGTKIALYDAGIAGFMCDMPM